MKKCIIIQGPTSWLNEIKIAYRGFEKNIIFSTWSDEKDKYNEFDNVIINEKPDDSGVGNLSYQQITTFNGLKYAKDIGYEYAIKIRSDMIPTNIIKFVNLFEEELQFFYWHNHEKGYLVDYFMGGEIQNMIDLWDIDISKKYRYAEEALTKNFFNKKLYEKKYNFIGKKINNTNDILWLKRMKFLSTYAADHLFLEHIKS